MKEPQRIPLTENPRSNEPQKRRLVCYPEPMTDDVWERIDTKHSPPIFAKDNHEKNNLENYTQSIQELESNKTN